MIARSLLLCFSISLCTACGGNGSAIGDRRCAEDTDCREDERCVNVTNVVVSTGDCFASSGVKVCRKTCADPADAKPCGCQ